MKLVELTENLVKSVVSDPDSVSVKAFDTDPSEELIIQVIVHEDDLGRVIGKQGRIANAIRTLVQASSYLNENRRINIKIDAI